MGETTGLLDTGWASLVRIDKLFPVSYRHLLIPLNRSTKRSRPTMKLLTPETFGAIAAS